jgi:hypothetical protein
MAQNTLTQEDWRSVLRGAVVNIGGTALLTFGMFLGSIGNDGSFNWLVLKIALATNLSTVVVNIAKKFLTT